MRRSQKVDTCGRAAGAILLALASVVSPRAQEPLSRPAPLARSGPAAPAGAMVVSMSSAQRAQDLGMPSIAAGLYRQALDAPGADARRLTLALATALLDAGQAAEAEQALARFGEPGDPAWQLRSGLAALQLRKRGAAQAAHDAINPDELAPADRPWYWFLRGALWDTVPSRDRAAITKANEFYSLAEKSATTELSRARFQLAAEKVRLRLNPNPSDADLRQARDDFEREKGSPIGYDHARYYAAMLAEAGQRADAVALLERVLLAVPPQQRAARDELRFTLGVIGDRGRSGAGRSALLQLLDDGHNAERQRQALQLLAETSRDEAARGQFRGDLDKLIARTPPHPILESLLFYRGQLALSDKDFVRAEEDASALLRQYPLSPLRVHAYGVLMQSAWEQQRYRTVADNARKARAELPGGTGGERPPPSGAGAAAEPAGLAAGGRARAQLGVLEAEASLRAGDYRNAADAYAAVLLERPPEFEPARLGALMFQRVLAEIRANGEAAKVLDELERDPAFDAENRWQAEWELARALQLKGAAGAREAYERVNTLLRAPSPGASAIKPELRARMGWLQARLSFENGDSEQTLKLVEAFLAAPLEIEPALGMEIASTMVLLKASAEFALGREPAALETLKRLRAEHRMTDAAISSHLIESEHYAMQDKIDEARRALIALTDDDAYKNSEYVPYALLRLALLSERLGREENLREANKRIEDLVTLVTGAGATPDENLLFAARLRQGDIFRKLNDFSAAQRAYEYLVNNHPRRPDVVLAQLALAECHNAQSSTDPDQSHADTAQHIFEQLRDRVDAPPDVRVEAGYNLGALLVRRGKIEAAANVWWNDVITPFLKEEGKGFERGAKRPYWLARTLLDLAGLLEKQGRIAEAVEAYGLVIEKRLPFGEVVARARLEHFGVAAAKP